MVKKLSFIIATAFVAICCGCAKDPGENPSKEKLDETVIEGFKMHTCLQDNMVLQRNRDFTFWGTATKGVKVFARPSWTDERYEGTAGADGIWKVSVPVPDAIKDNPAQSVKVYNGTDEYTLNNLLIGDVWILGGQSNMGISLSMSENGAAEIAAANQPLMRYYLCHQSGKNEPLFDWDSFPTGGHQWVAVSPSNADWIGAIGYYFAKYIIEKTGVPVGLLNTSMGGASILSYIPKTLWDSDKEISDHFNDIAAGRLHNSMVNPVMPYSCKGFLWYQGEADWTKFTYYPHAQVALMDYWRKNFNCPDKAPFYYAQLAPYAHSQDYETPSEFYKSGMYEGYPMMWEAQGSIRNLTTNTGMAVLMDVGDPTNIHPEKKQPVGERFARLALHNDYGMSDVECMGPVFKSKKLEDGVLKLSFDHADGLKTNDGKAPVHFYVAGNNPVYMAASAEIHGNEVWLTNDLIATAPSADLISVRYAFLYAAETNLENGSGLPAEPFRTDSWSTVTYNY